MAELRTLARPYARAAFEFAAESGSLAAWSEQLRLAATLAATGKVARVLGHPGWSAQRKAGIFRELCAEELTPALYNFIRLLADNKRLTLLPEISILFEQYRARRQKTVEVTVFSPFEVAPPTGERLARALTTKLQREVTVTTRIQADLLGGLLIRADDLVIDGSVRGHLQQLAAAMNSQE